MENGGEAVESHAKRTKLVDIDESDAECSDHIPVVPGVELRLCFRPDHVAQRAFIMRSVEEYERTLPRRENRIPPNNPFVLHRLPYFADPAEVDDIAKILENAGTEKRGIVHYMTSPSCSGKSTSILPIYLASHRAQRQASFTHYIHIACDNNSSRFFRWTKELQGMSSEDAYDHGAQFIFGVLKILLRDDQAPPNEPVLFPRNVDADLNEANPNWTVTCDIAKPPLSKTTIDKINSLLNVRLGACRVLFHLDEHKKMCRRDGPAAENGAAFSRGAMMALNQCGVVIATYTEPFLDASPNVSDIPGSTSCVCRIAVSKPTFHVDAACDYFNLNIPGAKVGVGQLPKAKTLRTRKANVAVIKFLLGYLFQFKMTGIHATPMDAQMRDFFDMFRAAASKTGIVDCDLLEVLNICRKAVTGILTKFQYGGNGTALLFTQDRIATKMLVGFPDEENILEGLRNVQIVAVPHTHYISSPLPWLLTHTDHGLYETGRVRFADIFLDYSRHALALPLERAYQWVISCRAALTKCAVFDRTRYDVGDNVVFKPGKIFDEPSNRQEDGPVSTLVDDRVILNLQKLQPGGVFYLEYADHPLCDMLITTTQNQVLMIDITTGIIKSKLRAKKSINSVISTAVKEERSSGKESGIQLTKKSADPARIHDDGLEKKTVLEHWIEENHATIKEQTGLSLVGILLAPFDTTWENPTSIDRKHYQLHFITGEDALVLLGGLRQIVNWMQPSVLSQSQLNKN